jgi:hypothetical protein
MVAHKPHVVIGQSTDERTRAGSGRNDEQHGDNCGIYVYAKRNM